ncbi:trypsin-like cysteine/serine peptidase domain-containing protein [Cladochytrium replicatum]|nr:trypsin-like cysteine/serine peptidase domain-containing protein [Cladochytrium replicatum]
MPTSNTIMMRTVILGLCLILAASSTAAPWHLERNHQQYNHRSHVYSQHSRVYHPLRSTGSMMRGSSRIVNGVVATAGQFPYLACLLDAANQREGCFCSGSFISATHVLTAAHCLEITTNILVVQNTLVGGRSNTIDNSRAIFFTTVRVYPHQQYGGVGVNDIAIIRVALRQDESTSQQIAVVSVPTNPAVCQTTGMRGIAAGFGLVDDLAENRNARLDTLRYAQLVTMQTQACINFFRNVNPLPLAQSVFCTEVLRKNDPSICNGDSGGPFLVAENGVPFVVGVVSGMGIVERNLTCGEANDPNIFTCVPSFASWISSVLRG